MIDLHKEKHPLTVCLIGVMDGNRVLLVKRKREPLSGYWGLIGGRQTFGKEIREVAHTEVKEETGFTIKNPTVNGIYSEILLDDQNKIMNHFLFIVLKAQLDKSFERNKNVENTDIDEFKWFDLPINEEDSKQIILSDLVMLSNFDSDKLVFKEFVMKKEEEKWKLVKVI